MILISTTACLWIVICVFDLQVIVEGLEKELIKDDKDRVFKSMDTDGSGSITYGELRNGLNAPRSHPNLSLSEARQLMEAVSIKKPSLFNCFVCL